MKRFGISVLAAAVVAGTPLMAQTFEDAVANGTTGAMLRLAHISQDNPTGTEDSSATAIGGQLKYETAQWNGLSFGAAAYVSQKIDALSGDGAKLNPDFFDDQQDSFAYIGEAYIDYSRGDFALRVGRQQIDTPLADTDDIRMLPNTFEAAIATYTGVEKLTLVGGYVTRWAGFDSGDDISKFKRLDGASSSGAAVAGAFYEGIDNLELQGWYYGIDELADAAFADAFYQLPINETIDMEFGAQAGYFSERKNSNIDGQVLGAFATAEVSAFRFSGAFNIARNGDGEAVTNGFGGGPYFTSMEEMTIDGLNDAEAYNVSVEADFEELGVKGLAALLAYGAFESGTTSAEKAEEIDMVVAYAMDEHVFAELSYAQIEDKNENLGGDWSRWLLRLNYNF